MNIQEAADKLRKLGVPGKEKETAIKNKLVHKDSAHVRRAVEKYIKKTLVRWAYTEKVIDPPTRRIENGKVVKGAGKTSNWPPKTIEEAAAVWAVRHSSIASKNALTPENISGIKEIVKQTFASLKVIHELPSNFILTTPNPSDIYNFNTLDTRLVKDKEFNQLLVTWIAAKAKVRNNEKANDEAERIKKIKDVHPELQEWERVSRELNAVSNPRYRFFKMDDPVRVIMHWHSRLLRIKNPTLKDVQTDEFDRTLEREGLLLDAPPDDFDLRRIPIRFRDVDDWFLRQECRIPPNAPSLQEFWSRYHSLPEDHTNDDIDAIIQEVIKDWRYIPTGWTFKFGRVELEALPSGQDDLVVFLDEQDIRKKALYAPFDEYNPYKTYGPENMGHLF